LEEKQNSLRMIREENKVAKSEVEHMEAKVGDAKDKIRRKDNEKLTCEKELADFN
jgi:soluble cytochrome b562